MGRRLGVTDQQMKIVLKAARQVPVTQRECFLAGIADDLLPREAISNSDVIDAVGRVCERFGGTVT